MQPKKYEALFILVRGLGRESLHWGEFPELLQKRLPNVLVKCIDLPGTGENIAMSSPIRMRDFSNFVRHEAEFVKEKMKLGDIKTFMLAPSLGGMIAADWMISYPKDLAGSILINTSFASWSTFWQRLQPQSYGHIVNIILSDNDALARESEVVKMVSNDKERLAMHTENWSKVYSKRPIRLSNILKQLIAAGDFSPPKIKISTPVLLLSSANDRMVDPRCSEAIQKVWGCPHFVHEWAGHDISLDDPEWIIDKTISWYESITQPVQQLRAN